MYTRVLCSIINSVIFLAWAMRLSTPNAKTAAAVRKQVPVVVDNILKLLGSQELVEGYDGYGSCPLTTSLNTVMLAEFCLCW